MPWPTPVQVGTGLTTGSGTSRTAVVTTPTNTGDTLLVNISTNSTSCTISALTDSKGNVYTLDGSYVTTVPLTYWYRCPGATGGPGGTASAALTTSDTLTATSTGTGNVEIQVINVPAAGPLDVMGTAVVGNSANPSASVTPSVANDIVVSLFTWAFGGGAPTYGTPCQLAGSYQTGVNPNNYAFYVDLTGGAGVATSAASPTNIAATAQWRGIAYSFKAAAGTWAAGSVMVDTSSASGTITLRMALGSVMIDTATAVGFFPTPPVVIPPTAPIGYGASSVSPSPGNTYRYITTDTVTGRVLSDSLPITGLSAQSQINSVGSFSGNLILPTAGAATRYVPTWISAVRPWRSILWILQNGTPIWNGPITAWNHQSAADGTLPLQAASMEEFFKHRQVDTNMVMNNVDVFEIFRLQLLYALGKTPNGNIAGTGRYANQSGIVDVVQYSGVIGSVVEADSLKKIYDCWNDLVTTYGLEYTLQPMITSAGSLFTLVRLGLPLLGRRFMDTQLQLVFPSRGLIDYAFPWTPQSAVNRIIVTGSGGGSNSVNYQVAATGTIDGMPLLEDSQSFTGTVTSQAQIQRYANSLVVDYAPSQWLNPMFTCGDNAVPQVRDVQLGDEIRNAMTSPLHPADARGRPGYTGTFRLTGWQLNFPAGNQTEQAVYTLGAGNAISLQGF